MQSKVRVRFAPSPTGALHIGGLRTALYNYVYARQNGGDFILRIEDTDQTRLVSGAEDYIVSALKWMGLDHDEGPQPGGPHAPYRQSERAAIYSQYAQELIDKDLAYYAFDTPEELDAMRKKLQEAKAANQQYNSITRVNMRNSLTLSRQEVQDLMDQGVPYVVRIKIPPKEDIRFKDIIRGWVKVQGSTLDDKVILKSGGLPTYHLANVVDDHLMQITHVIRGEEWLPSAPLHVLLYRFLGWESEMPEFAHLPLILKPDGKGKLSKRDADKAGFPIFPLSWDDPLSGEVSTGFKERGYLPEALANFLAFLGWNPGTEQELFTFDELTAAFDLERIIKSGAKFDIEKAKWYNQHYLREKPTEELADVLRNQLEHQGLSGEQQKLEACVELVKERITFPQELWEECRFIFGAPAEYAADVVAKRWSPEVESFLQEFIDKIATLSSNRENYHNLITEMLQAREWGFGKVMPILRVALTGQAKGPDLMQIMSILGSDEVSNRVVSATTKFNEIIDQNG